MKPTVQSRHLWAHNASQGRNQEISGGIDDQQISLVLELNTYKRECHQQDSEQEDNDDAVMELIRLEQTQEDSSHTVWIGEANQGVELGAKSAKAESTLHTKRSPHRESQFAPNDATDQEAGKPTLLDILNEGDDINDMEEDNLTDEE